MEELRRQAGWAKTFGLPLELISAEEAQELFPLMSTEGVLGAAVAADRRLPRPVAAHLRARRGRSRGRRADLHGHARDGDRAGPRAHRARRHRRRGRGDRGRHVLGRARPARGRAHPDRADVARVHRDPAVPRARSAEPAADAARPGPAHLLPRGGRRPRDGRLRAPCRAGVHAARRRGLRPHPARLQRPPARGRLGPLRGDRRELAPARAADGGREGHAHDQRAGGVHAGQRVLPRRDGGAAACSWRAASARTGSRARAAWAR